MIPQLGTGATLVAYAALLTVAFAAAYGVGAVSEPVAADRKPSHSSSLPHPEAPAPAAGSASGHAPGSGGDVPAGSPVTAYRETHERDLHLIVVRRDLAGFQHVHPVQASDGTLTLGTDVAVAGHYTPAALPAPAGADAPAQPDAESTSGEPDHADQEHAH